ncbi:hypothetical protein U1839_02510 [Sphingomonas sp. RT2P30]|uniref:hypothetical protein n=1 Tax=Parasphingomonas halimpatiens TaxID=3096162 RepID=UPI002FC5D4DE
MPIAALAALSLGSCAPVGAVDQRIGKPPTAILFSWHRQGPRSGAISTVFADGRRYDGSFYQITSKTRLSEIRPLRLFWGIGSVKNFGGLGDWNDGVELLTRFAGRMLAILRGPDGLMRCSFSYSNPSLGMAGGGTGWCQLSRGGGIEAAFPPGPSDPGP